MEKIDDDLGTAVNVQSMVFGNKGDDSGTGVAFTRNPATGENIAYGDFLKNAQGEDVVAGIRTTEPLDAMGNEFPECHTQLLELMQTLQSHYRDMCDIEFTIEQGRLFLLQTRVGKRTAAAALRMAVEMEEEGLIDQREAVLRVQPAQLDQLLHPQFDPKAEYVAVTKGLNASPGAAVGRVYFTADLAEHHRELGEDVILVRPGDVARRPARHDRGRGHPHVARRARQPRGGRGARHGHARGVRRQRAADRRRRRLRSRSTARPCVRARSSRSTARPARSWSARSPWSRPTPAVRSRPSSSWADTFRRMKVRTNADLPHDAQVARRYGAEGIGLCRTEHMFLGDRLPLVQRFILADSPVEEEEALAELEKLQRSDFEGIFEAMDGLPVTIRLLDPPLHEFLPDVEELLIHDAKGELDAEGRRLLAAAQLWRESNPMLGTRGCRLGIIKPGLYKMQAKAIIEAAVARKQAGGDPHVEIMIPLIVSEPELALLTDWVREVATVALAEAGVDAVDYLVGTMIETPRAALAAGEIAEVAEFFSFGTNDLTQMTFGFSRDDVEGRFMSEYLELKLLRANPFETLDQEGVGQLVQLGVERGRATRPGIKLGICGEHGGDPASVEFCDRIGLDYVSCSPYRVPIARLAAAHASLGHDGPGSTA